MINKTNSIIYLLLKMVLLLFLIVSCESNLKKPSLTTNAVTDITYSSAISGGDVISDGDETVIYRGVCWSTNQTPTISDNITTDGNGTGSFVSNISGLNSNTTYYLRAYATNSNGTGYGNVISFTTQTEIINGTFTDTRDGTVYNTIKIGSQTWMRENLCYLPSVVDPTVVSYITPYYYVYGYRSTNVNEAKVTSNYSTYGVLYNWAAACSSCPSGWHLPSDSEWEQLVDYLDGSGIAGMKLKEAGNAHWGFPNILATNESNFTALPGGRRTNMGTLETFWYITETGHWWSTTGASANNAWCIGMDYSGAGANMFESTMNMGLSVRCVKN